MLQMNEFRLFAHGKDFDAEAYIASSPLPFDGLWRRGDSGHDHPRSSGVFKVLGDGTTLPIMEQESIAIDYLTANREALKELARAPGVTTFILGLQYAIEIEERTISFCVGPSLGLMSVALDIGIVPTYYVMIRAAKDST